MCSVNKCIIKWCAFHIKPIKPIQTGSTMENFGL